MRIDRLGDTGLSADRLPSTLSAREWSAMQNIETIDGDLRSAYGEIKNYHLNHKPKEIFFYLHNNVYWLIYTDGIKVYARNGAIERDITPAKVASEGVWQFLTFNGVLIANDSRSAAYFLNDGPEIGQLEILPEWGDAVDGSHPGWRANKLVAYKNYLVAVGMFEAGQYRNNLVRWCSASAQGEVPLEWIPRPTNTAGFQYLAETQSELMLAEWLRDSIMIIANDGTTFIMDWIGGNYVFRFTRVTDGVVPLSPKSVTEWRGQLVVVTDADVMVFDGQQTKSLLNERVRRYLLDRVDIHNFDQIRVFTHYPKSQIWLAYPGRGDDRLTHALIYRWEEDSWAERELNHVLALGVGAIDKPNARTYNSVSGNPEYAYDYPRAYPEMLTYDELEFEAAEETLYFAESDLNNTAWSLTSLAINKNTDSNGDIKHCFAERISIPLGTMGEVGQLTCVYPELKATGPVTFTFGTQDHPNDTVTWDAPQQFDGDVQRKIDLRVSGNMLAMRVESDSDVHWRLSAIALDIQGAGTR